jgi:hypothetical protein
MERQYWVEAKLSGGEGSLGLVYQLEHHGFPCQFHNLKCGMVVIDVTGVHTITIRYCGCEQHERTDQLNLGQLLGNRWYPATTIDPEMCMTLQVLEFFRLLNVVGNMNVHDFMRVLEHKMDLLGISRVPVCFAVLTLLWLLTKCVGSIQSFWVHHTPVRLSPARETGGMRSQNRRA